MIPEHSRRAGDGRHDDNAAGSLPSPGYFINAQLLSGADAALIVHPHAQRTGGSFMRSRVLAEAFGTAQIYNAYTVKGAKEWRDLSDADVAGYRAFTGHFDFRRNRLTRPVLALALLRDPVERAVSLYHYVKTKQGHVHQALAQNSTLEDFYRRASKESPRYFRNQQCRRICGSSRASVALATILRSYVGVGLTDSLNAFADGLGTALGWRDLNLPAPALPKRIDDEITPRFRALVLKENAEDQVLFEAVRSGPPYALAKRSSAETIDATIARVRSDAQSLFNRFR